MKLLVTLATLASATKECNGPRYKPLGCFDDVYPHPEKMPQAIKLIHPQFKLTNLAYENIEIDWENPPIQRFNPLQDVIIMTRTHGYKEHWGKYHWLNAAHDAFTQDPTQPVNFIGIDWKLGAENDDYEQAVADSQIVGRAITHLLKELISHGMRPAQFKCIGHGLGAHVCAWAGKHARVQVPRFTLDRITGLDPAGRWFEDLPKEGRLDKDDANFVDVIHTNAGESSEDYYGIRFPCGDADFWPNAGVDQPQCEDCTVCETEKHCSHEEAAWIFIDSVKNSACLSIACQNIEGIKDGFCSCRRTGCSPMGWPATKPVQLPGQAKPTNFWCATNRGATHGAINYCRDGPDPGPWWSRGGGR